MAGLLRLALMVCLLLPAGVAQALPAHFGLFVGNNRWVPAQGASRLPDLRHGDDDALLGAAVFESLHPDATTWRLVEPDPDTLTLHPELRGGGLLPPTRAGLDRAVSELREAIEEARRQGHHPIQLFVHFSGHGEQGGALHLADARVDAEALLTRLGRLGAHTTFALLDACYLGRILKGSEEQLITREQLFGDPPLLSGLFMLGLTTAAPEYTELEGGLLSLVALTGLAGPADRDNDGLITFREWKLFVAEQLESFPEPPGLRARDLEPQKKVVVADLRGVGLGGISLPRSLAPGLLRVHEQGSGRLVSELMLDAERSLTLHLPPGTYSVLHIPTPRSWDERAGLDAIEVKVQIFRRVVPLPSLPGQVAVHLQLDRGLRGEVIAGEARGVSLQDELWIRSRLGHLAPAQDPTPEGTWAWIEGGVGLDPAGGLHVPGGEALGPGLGVRAGRIVPATRWGRAQVGLGVGLTYGRRPFDRLCSADTPPLCLEGVIQQHQLAAGPELGVSWAGPHLRVETRASAGLALAWMTEGGAWIGPGDLIGQGGEDYLLASLHLSGAVAALYRAWDRSATGPAVRSELLLPLWWSPATDRPVGGYSTQAVVGWEFSHQF